MSEGLLTNRRSRVERALSGVAVEERPDGSSAKLRRVAGIAAARALRLRLGLRSLELRRRQLFFGADTICRIGSRARIGNAFLGIADSVHGTGGTGIQPVEIGSTLANADLHDWATATHSEPQGVRRRFAIVRYAQSLKDPIASAADRPWHARARRNR